MLCVTLTLAKTVRGDDAWQTVDQLVESLSGHPDALGGLVSGFKAIGPRQVQGCLTSADETVGFILSAARSGTWGVLLTLLPEQQGDESHWRDEVDMRELLRSATAESVDTLRAPGGVRAMMAKARDLVDGKHIPELGSVESGLQLLCAIERRGSDEGQEAGQMINAGISQSHTAQHFGVSQQAISARLQSGYWYESRRMAYSLAVQIHELLGEQPRVFWLERWLQGPRFVPEASLTVGESVT